MSAPLRARTPASHFEALYESSTDPWDYLSSAYESEKYAATLAAIGPGPFAGALEVGCSIGIFSAMLAPRCGELVAMDFSARALRLAGARLADLANLELVQGSFPEQAPERAWELVVCSEVLYYLDRPALAMALQWLRVQLAGGARVVVVSWRGPCTSEPLCGDEVHDMLVAELAAEHAFDGRSEGYRLDCFDRNER
ncbi:MAG: methyltransferase domain-containing protein [Solirubrobacterales bacterium]|nr:methyltransferase domain-containing protein [Solirubrobacterales bacterium]